MNHPEFLRQTEERLLRYAAVTTQSSRSEEACPSSPGQRELAKHNAAGYSVLDAGRGNPNWINTQARYAYTRFSDFATRECELDMNEGSMAGHARQEGIGERFDAEMDPENATDAFLIAAVVREQ